jgi:hypothetical protein
LTVRHSRTIRVIATLVVAIALRTTYALPMQTTAAVRALACCAEHCGHSHSLPGAARCCTVAQDATDLAHATGKSPDVTPAAIMVAPVGASLVHHPSTPVAGLPAGHERDGPIFLRTCSLRR